MALFDFFKKSKRQPAPPKQSEQKAGAGKPSIKLGKSGKAALLDKKSKKKNVSASTKRKRGETATAGAKLKVSKFAWQILREPHVTEKSTDLTSQNKYTFKISDDKTKLEVKRAIEDVYGVSVVGVNKISIPKKQRRRGRQIGWRSGYTKAVVTLKEGDKIEVLPH